MHKGQKEELNRRDFLFLNYTILPYIHISGHFFTSLHLNSLKYFIKFSFQSLLDVTGEYKAIPVNLELIFGRITDNK